MAHDHSIALGDHLVRLAYMHAHATTDALWMHDANEALRDARPNPGVLQVGDVVHVPDAPARTFSGKRTRREHRLVVELPQTVFTVQLKRNSRVPYVGVCRVEFDGVVEELPLNADGQIEVEIGPHTTTVALAYGVEYFDVAIAHLQPITTVQGLVARLANLGYQPGGLDGDTPTDAYAMRSAVEEFQCDFNLLVDGQVGDNTLAALAEQHGS